MPSHVFLYCLQLCVSSEAYAQLECTAPQHFWVPQMQFPRGIITIQSTGISLSSCFVHFRVVSCSRGAQRKTRRQKEDRNGHFRRYLAISGGFRERRLDSSTFQHIPRTSCCIRKSQRSISEGGLSPRLVREKEPCHLTSTLLSPLSCQILFAAIVPCIRCESTHVKLRK